MTWTDQQQQAVEGDGWYRDGWKCAVQALTDQPCGGRQDALLFPNALESRPTSDVLTPARGWALLASTTDSRTATAIRRKAMHTWALHSLAVSYIAINANVEA